MLPLLLAVSHAHTGGPPPAVARVFPLHNYPLARCLDGSVAAYYYAPGSERTKWLIFHEGGGFCTDIADCAKRAQSYLGTTTNDASTKKLSEPYFSLDAEANPLLHNYSKVFVRYCDGAYYSGGRREPLSFNGSSIFFSGSWITEAVITDLSTRHGLGDATDVVLSGCSAGAIRIFAHVDQLASRVRAVASGARVVGFADSGFYMDLDIFTPLKRFVVEPAGQNATALLAPSCKARHAGQEEKCLIASVVAASIQTPIFSWQSEYDHDQRGCEMTPQCAAEASCVNAYGRNLSSTLIAQLLGLGNQANGAFLDSCTRHCTGGGPHWGAGTVGLHIDGQSPLQAFAVWHRHYSAGADSAGVSFGQKGQQRRLWQLDHV